MRDRSWRRHQRERAIQRVLSNIKKNREWWYTWYVCSPQPHRFWEDEERINTFPAYDSYRPAMTWEDVFNHRRVLALTRHSTRAKCSCQSCGNPRKWWGDRTRQEKLAEINHYEQLEELNEEHRQRKPTIWRPKWYYSGYHK